MSHAVVRDWRPSTRTSFLQTHAGFSSVLPGSAVQKLGEPWEILGKTRDIHPAPQHCFQFQAAILHEMTLTLRIAGALLDSAEALNRNSHA